MEQQPRPNDDTIMTMTSNITTFPYKRAHSVLALGNLDSHFKFKLPDITFLKVELNTRRTKDARHRVETNLFHLATLPFKDVALTVMV